MALLTFDSAFYLQNNPDVLRAVADGSIPSAEWHYANYGWKELRDPSPNFDTSYYLTENPDVLAAGINPLEHFERWGAAEGRAPNANFVAAENFDADRYLVDNPDVVGSGLTAYQHYALYGWNEGRPAFTLAGEPVIGGGTADLNLTTNIETINGTAGNDVFVAGVEGGVLGTLVNTLQTGDVLNGGAGQDTLRADIVAGINPVITPTLNSVETVDVRFLGGSVLGEGIGVSVLDLSRSTGVQTINVHDSASQFMSENAAIIGGVKGASTFNVADQDVDTAFLGGTAESITLNVANVGNGSGFGLPSDEDRSGVGYASNNGALNSATVTIANSDVDVFIADDEIETLTASVNASNANIVVGEDFAGGEGEFPEVGELTAEGVVGTLNLTVTNSAADEDSEAEGVNVFAGTIGEANLTLTDSDVSLWAAAEEVDGEDRAVVTAAVAGANTLGGTYVNEITSLTVTGEGSLDVVGDLSNVETLDASNAGGIVAGGLDTSAVSVTTGAGNDSITFSSVSGGTDAVAGGASVDLGAGDDVLTINGEIGLGTEEDEEALATLAGGEGTDTIVLSSAVAGDVITEGEGANVSISGFEVLEISDTLEGAVDASQFGLNEVVLAAGFGAEAAITGLESDATVTLEDGAATGEETLVIAIDGAAEAADDVLNLNLSADYDADFGNIQVSDVETINLVVTDTGVAEGEEADGVFLDLSVAGVENIVITGNGSLALNSEEGAYLSDTVESIDASALEGDFNVGITAGGEAGVTILGSQGNNIILGGSGDDTITTQGGDDVIIGGLGADEIDAGDGVNTFVYLSAADSSGLAIDTITGFQAGTATGAVNDLIDLRTIQNAFNFEGILYLGEVGSLAAANTALTNSATDNLELVFDTGSSQLYADVTGDGQINSGDLIISLVGVTDLSQANFLGSPFVPPIPDVVLG